MSEEKNINYISAFDELQMIVKEIESGDISVDELSEKVKRASTLIAICKEKLFRTEDDVNQILKDLEAE
jgi:exodeoxyribonuclease VII small subunit